MADETYNEHVLKPFFKVIRKSLYREELIFRSEAMLAEMNLTPDTLLTGGKAIYPRVINIEW